MTSTRRSAIVDGHESGKVADLREQGSPYRPIANGTTSREPHHSIE
jgi:hypothetical protein